ncbi:hypothetical protein DVH24_023250 [Malus domestica]|uniref:ATP synthase protein MI25 n=1 Tax=Malus domestica TaxID=3750 RepID=A0A498KNL6_MALDO|nr:hypothetical protein DVH24_023250 [Malus domestica]
MHSWFRNLSKNINCDLKRSTSNTFKVTLDGRIQAIQEESQQFPNPNEVVPPESNEQQRLLRISLRICGTVVESLPIARCAPKCEKTVQALLCRNLNVKPATLTNAISSRRIRLQDDLVTGFHFSVSERFVLGYTLNASMVERIREGLVVLRSSSDGISLGIKKTNRIKFIFLRTGFGDGIQPNDALTSALTRWDLDLTGRSGLLSGLPPSAAAAATSSLEWSPSATGNISPGARRLCRLLMSLSSIFGWGLTSNPIRDVLWFRDLLLWYRQLLAVGESCLKTDDFSRSSGYRTLCDRLKELVLKRKRPFRGSLCTNFGYWGKSTSSMVLPQKTTAEESSSNSGSMKNSKRLSGVSGCFRGEGE